MNSRRSSEFAADPVTTKPISKTVLPEPVSPPHLGESAVGSILPGSNSLPTLYTEGFAQEGLSPSAFHVGHASAEACTSPSSFQDIQDRYSLATRGSSPGFGANSNDWQHQNQLQHLVNQQALLHQLQSKLQMSQIGGQGLSTSPNQGVPQSPPLASLLSQQLHTPAMNDHSYHSLESQATYPSPHAAVPMHWPVRLKHPHSPPSPFAGSPSPPSVHSLAESQGYRHSHSPLEERRNSRGHTHGSNHGMKGRPIDIDPQYNTIDKLRREIGRLQSEVDRLEKEVARQKSLRETERIEFTDAKDRVRHSWAVDRDDFARVKSLLKTKNAEHHAQSGRLSQQLKEAEAINRGLRDICTRHGVAVPPELEVTHSRRHSMSPVPRSSTSVPSLPGSQVSVSTLSEAPSVDDAAMTSRTPSEASFDSDVLERLAAARISVRNPNSPPTQSCSQPPSPVSAATAVLQMVQQLQHVVPVASDSVNASKVSPRVHSFEDMNSEPINEAAMQAAVQAATALSQLAAALSCAKLSPFDTACNSKPASPRTDQADDKSHPNFENPLEGQTEEELGQYALTDTNLNRMSLQSWVKPSDKPSQSPSYSSRSGSPQPVTDEQENADKEGPPSPNGGQAYQFSLSQRSLSQSQEDGEIQMWPVSPQKQNPNNNPGDVSQQKA